jgi:hypothetical protein
MKPWESSERVIHCKQWILAKFMGVQCIQALFRIFSKSPLESRVSKNALVVRQQESGLLTQACLQSRARLLLKMNTRKARVNNTL